MSKSEALISRHPPRLGGTRTASRNGKIGKKELREATTALGFHEEQSLLLFTGTIEEFRTRWLIDIDDQKAVMKQCREMATIKPNPFMQWLIRMRMAFFNADFGLTSDGGVKETADWLSSHAAYPFSKLSRDIWQEYEICSNVVAFWRGAPNGPRNGPAPPPETVIDKLPRVTIFDSERVRYVNDFGTQILYVTPARRKLSDVEEAALGKRYADAIKEGKELRLDPKKGEFFKVLTTAKSGNGLGMPRWKAIMHDLATLELLKVGDWNGAWARRKIMRQTKKGHQITGGGAQGGPDFFMKPEFAKKLLKVLNNTNGYAELVSNFDQMMEYVFLEAGFFDPKVYEAVELRLDRYAGSIGMMMREGQQQSPYLMSIFRAEGLAEREIVGSFIRELLNDENFLGDEKVNAPLLPRWDDTIFFNEKMLMAWLGFAYQYGFASPQTMRRYMRLSENSENELMDEAHKAGEHYEPVFEPKQGLLGDGGAAGGAGGRPARQDGVALQ